MAMLFWSPDHRMNLVADKVRVGDNAQTQASMLIAGRSGISYPHCQ